jgi:hypothetical protein
VIILLTIDECSGVDVWVVMLVVVCRDDKCQVYDIENGMGDTGNR